MARPLTSYLISFDERQHQPDFHDDVLATLSQLDEAAPAMHEAFPTPVDDDTKKQAYDEGFAAAKQEADLVIARTRIEAVQQMHAERARWVTEEGERLAATFNTSLQQNLDGISADIERILRPFVSRQILENILSDFSSNLRMAIGNMENPVIQLSGPEDFVGIISAKLGGEGIATNISDLSGVEVRARIGSTILETRLAEWIEKLRGGE